MICFYFFWQDYGISVAFEGVQPHEIPQGDGVLIQVKATITEPNFLMEMTVYQPEGLTVS